MQPAANNEIIGFNGYNYILDIAYCLIVSFLCPNCIILKRLNKYIPNIEHNELPIPKTSALAELHKPSDVK